MRLSPLAVIALAALPLGCSEAPAFCGTTLWQYAWQTVTNSAFRTGDECFQVQEEGARTRFLIPFEGDGDCSLSGARAGDVVTFDEGSCVVPSAQSGPLSLFTRWYATGGTATFDSATDGWSIRANLDVTLLFHDGSWGDLDVETGTGTIAHDATLQGTVAYAADWGHPCTPASIYHAVLHGEVKSAVGAMASCDALLQSTGEDQTFDYAFSSDGKTVSYGGPQIRYALLPDQCLVVYDESSDAWQTELDLAAKTALVTARQTGPYISGQGSAQCVLEWTGPLTEP